MGWLLAGDQSQGLLPGIQTRLACSGHVNAADSTGYSLSIPNFTHNGEHDFAGETRRLPIVLTIDSVEKMIVFGDFSGAS